MSKMRLQEVVLKYGEDPAPSAAPTQQEVTRPSPAETDPREKYTTRLPKSVVKAVKQLGLDTEQPDYAVVEAAIREYLAKHGR